MKKILFLLVTSLLLAGCDDKVTTVTDANGDSKTYQFFVKQNYNSEKYTLNLKNEKSDIIIVNSKDKVYYKLKGKTGTTEIIEKDLQKYIISSNTNSYTKEPIVLITNYGYGYVPENMDILKTADYKTGKEKIGWFKYVFEEYSYKGGTTTYYFRGDKLRYIKNTTTMTEETVEFISVSNKIDNKNFNLPKDYQEITY